MPPLEALAFIKAEWLKPLWKQLDRISGERAKEIDRLRDEFVNMAMPYFCLHRKQRG